MSYFKILGFEKEPFSTSPDPDFFYLSKEHEASLTSLLIELRLKRGLSVILGDIGTGKTTLSRKLLQELKEREDFIFHIIFDPSFESRQIFLTSLVRNFDISLPQDSSSTILDLRDAIESFLFQKGVNEGKTIVLIIDEAQKLNEETLEVLRVLLNYETNQFKLLQLILLGQLELYSKIITIPNFLDRINFKYTLNPLNFEETKQMIEFRIRQAGYKANMHLFLEDALTAIHQYTYGYPRKITMLCHRALKTLVLKNKFSVDRQIIEEIINEDLREWPIKNNLLRKSDF